MHVAFFFTNDWLESYVIPKYVVTDYETIFVIKHYTATCAQQEAKHFTITVYQIQTNWQPEKFRKPSSHEFNTASPNIEGFETILASSHV